MEKHKVIIWGMGSCGRSALQEINLKESLELVAAYDVDPDKIGKDAGEICGFEKSGVIVSGNVDEVLAVEADVVLYYTPPFFDEGKPVEIASLTKNVDEICTILASGKNVTTTVILCYLEKTAPEFYERIDNVAKEHGVTYTPQGIYPGLFTPYIPTVIGSMSRKIDSVVVTLGENDAANTAPWTAIFGFGKVPEANPTLELFENWFLAGYGVSAIELAERLGLDYDEYTTSRENILADKEYVTPVWTIKPGTLLAHKLTMSCKKNGKVVSELQIFHKGCGTDLCPDLPEIPTIEFTGEPNIKCTIDGVLNMDDPFGTSASPNVNLIPGLVKAEPGYHNALDIAMGYLPR